MSVTTIFLFFLLLQLKELEKYICFGEAERQTESLQGVSHYLLQLGKDCWPQMGFQPLELHKQTVYPYRTMVIV